MDISYALRTGELGVSGTQRQARPEKYDITMMSRAAGALRRALQGGQTILKRVLETMARSKLSLSYTTTIHTHISIE